jgi:protein-disulfide isomerase
MAVLLKKTIPSESKLNGKPKTAEFLTVADMAELVSNNPPTIGKTDAPVTLVLFSDFQCPYCRQLAFTLKQLDPKIKGDVRIVFHQFPLPMHQFAYREAELTACTAQQSTQAFWALYDFLYTGVPIEEDFTDVAVEWLKSRNDVKVSELSECVQAHQTSGLVERDISLGKSYGVLGTPTMFINGQRVIGDPQQHLAYLLRSMANRH